MDEQQLEVTGAEASVPPSRPVSVARRVALLCTAMAAGVVGLVAFLGQQTPMTDALRLPWWSLALLFVVTSGVQLHVEVRRSAHTVTLTDLAVVVALFSAAPALVPVLRAITWVPLCAWRYRHSGRRAIFNALLGPLETAIASTVFTLAAHGALVRDPRSWLAAYLAVFLAGLVGALLVTTVISINDGHLATSPLREAVTLGTLVAGATSTLGLVGVLLVDTTPAARWVLVALAAVLMLGYRSYATLRERHHGLESLFGFTRSLAQRSASEDALPTLLRLASERLGGDTAELMIDGWRGTEGTSLVSLQKNGEVTARPVRLDEHWPLARVLAEQTPMLLSERSKDEAVRRYLRRVGRKEMLLAPLRGENTPLGVLAVYDRSVAGVRRFTQDDLRLLETMAAHGGAELSNARLVDRLRHDAGHDALTGLRNRSVLIEAVAELAAAGETRGTSGAVALFDLDDFKQVNDALGHHVGDLLLRHVAERLSALIPAGSAVCRLGGDEFAVVLSGADEDAMLAEVRGLREQLTRPIDLGPVTVSSGASVGLVFVGPHGRDALQLLQRADIAMYAAKRTSRDVVIFDVGLESARPERLGLASDLRRLLAGEAGCGRLEVHYQPQIDAPTDTVGTVEALVRWLHPELGLLPPDEFVPIAESTGLAGALTHAVLATALVDLRTWEAAGHRLTVAVNLSARSLHEPSLVDDITAALVSHGIAPGRLTLELTESSIVSDPARASEVFDALAARGVRLSVDDFGTGYSSLSHLARLPVAEVKVDKGFVLRMRSDAKDRAIVRSVIRLADELGMAVVAEGVEDLETARELTELGCAVLQGYLFSRPVPAPALLEWLQGRVPGATLRIVG